MVLANFPLSRGSMSWSVLVAVESVGVPFRGVGLGVGGYWP